jgi:spermidine/putrescine transport system permease protein
MEANAASIPEDLPGSVGAFAVGRRRSAPFRRDAASRTGSLTAALWVLPGAIWLVVFAVAPMLLLIAMSFWTSTIFGLSTDLTLENYRALASDFVYCTIMLQTLRIAVVTTALALIISYPMAWFLITLREPAKSTALLFLFLPFWTSYVVRTFIWLPLLGRNGLINHALIGLGLIGTPLDWMVYNEGTVYLGLVYVYLLFMTLPIFLSLDRLDRSLIEAAADLGAGPFRTFRRVVLPLSAPGVMSGCIMVFLLACGAYVTPQLLGGTAGTMFGNIIAAEYLQTNNWALGAALSVVLIAVVMLCLFVVGRRVQLNEVFVGGRS